jgi:membrane protein
VAGVIAFLVWLWLAGLALLPVPNWTPNSSGNAPLYARHPENVEPYLQLRDSATRRTKQDR